MPTTSQNTARIAGAALALLILPASANAAIFTDRAAFNATLGAHTFIDFENLVGTPEYPANYGPGVGHSDQPGGGGITIGIMHFNNNINANFIIGLLRDTYSMGSYNALGGYRDMTISLAGGVTAFGFDVGEPEPGWGVGPMPFTISVRPVGGSLAPVANQIGVRGPNFFGYTGDAFDQVHITGDFSFYVYFDNVAFGQVASAGAVPEPATWAMLIAGFGLVGAAARKRRPTTVHA